MRVRPSTPNTWLRPSESASPQAVARSAVAAGADPAAAETDARRRASALTMLAGAIGAFGGVLVNLAFRQAFLAPRRRDAAYVGFLPADAGCSAPAWAVWLRRR